MNHDQVPYAVLLSGHAHFMHWGVIQISLANLIVIVLMIIVFAFAVVLQMPHSRKGRHDSRGHDDES